ncbi:hypothetical protein [Roseiconus lacunae]|uniref:DUF2357 domain-containing protein n=1 Tax=Roseiconus lacunae TaxID=2605694 RepID=A0ABT7PF67_9BACT|nr:hypothetical protein [Roseiconus lacunae]MDM4015111.1 hypothetical protein [Roseiconus lacunae]
MIDNIQLAIRKYQRFVPDPSLEMSNTLAMQLSEWLEFDVGRVVDRLLERPDFRNRVRWPLDFLAHDQRGRNQLTTQHRELLLDVDGRIVNLARELVTLAESERFARLLEQPGRQEAEARGNEPSGWELQSGLSKMRDVAERTWDDLVSARDYFHPAQPPVGPGNLQHGSFLPYLQPRLRPPGDFVSRCAEVRIRELIEDVEKFYRRLWDLHRVNNLQADSELAASGELLQGLRERFAELRRVCFDGRDARFRDSCIALFQVYVGFRQNLSFEWLGLPTEYYQRIADLPHRVERRHLWDVPERAFEALNEILEVARRAVPPDEVIEEQKAKKRLVLVEEQRSVFLDGARADTGRDVAWHGKHSLQWELLWTLADRAMVRRNVDGYDLSNPKSTPPGEDGSRLLEPLSHQAVKDRRSGLKKLISNELNAMVESAGPGTYRLNLEPNEICLLGWFTEERLGELDPQPARHSSFTRFAGR